ncbi:large-conductance mechanosensitive channel protein MscL [Candidatus Gracilibacteria bacterium]|nr:large-conductance mechanosensitive channel protein MscL [Candidatus Gracilibacteria bacterium]
MSILKEFRDFAMKGNVIDLAVGVVIGSAFGKIVSSLVSDIIMPIIGFLTAGVDVKDLVYTFQAPVLDGSIKMVELKWGMFIQTMLDFIIIAFAIFIFIKLISKATRKKQNPETPPAGPTELELLTEIRDLLKK